MKARAPCQTLCQEHREGYVVTVDKGFQSSLLCVRGARSA